MTWEILEGHVLDVLRNLPAESVRCVVTSPPYWGLRDYGVAKQVWGGRGAHDHEWESLTKKSGAAYLPGSKTRWQHEENGRGEPREVTYRIDGHPSIDAGGICDCGAWNGALGLEPDPAMYVDHMVAVMAEVRRVLTVDGTVWLNLGDSYAAFRSGPVGALSTLNGSRHAPHENRKAKEAAGRPNRRWSYEPWGLKPKDLIGIPWRVAFALQADGWWLRSGIVWSKSNPMPESVTDRPTQAHEFVFLLARSSRYYYDADAIREPHLWPAGPNAPASIASPHGQGFTRRAKTAADPHAGGRRQAPEPGEPGAFHPSGRNRRSVWEIPTSPFPQAHFATFPKRLVEPCILAGSAAGDTVLDPFSGAGTTGVVALQRGRSYLGIELNPEYAEMSRRRIHNEAGLFSVQETPA